MEKWVRQAIRLSWFTILYNTLEGLVSIYYGITDESVALFGFGADSFIEVFSAALVLWRFRGEWGRLKAVSVSRERQATLGIGMLFLLLAITTAAGSILQLIQHKHPETTLPGAVIAAASLSFMVFLWKAKKKVGTALNSKTVLSDADCSLACIKLSVVLFCGSLVYQLSPLLWWSDSIAALMLSWFVLREGVEMIRHARSDDFDGSSCCG
ncbi:MAG: cation transporter [Bdellovibrionales bacterium]|nr:cation transporter [Bdellovibrionales bacterium]